MLEKQSPLKIIDKYIILKFLGTFFFAIALIVLIAVVFDVSEKLDDFIEKKATVSVILFDYYLYFIPYFVNLFSPLFVFIAVIFFTSKMASNTEIVAILNMGVSFRRFLVPYMMGALVIALVSLLFNHILIPPANKKRLEFENIYINSPFRHTGRNIHIQTRPGTFIYFENYNNENDVGYRFSMEKFDNGKMNYKLVSEYIKWDSTKQHWTVHNYFIRNIDGLNETIRSGTSFDTTLNFLPSDFGKRLTNIETLNYFELNRFIKEEKLKGSDYMEFYLVEKYKRTSLPFATFILTLIGVGIASRKVRGGIGTHIGAGLLLSFSYIMFMQIANTFATYGELPVLLAVWIPNIIYGVMSIFLIKYSPK